ncbi:MAG: Gfo/Idh/MocA family oxidoreductase [Kiritimatiellae bacterium]|nr:Gfo/Idh/MocA family oxidoreductase [Kiritimatiellia bacterium]
MKPQPLKTLFYGITHEHAPGKLETLKRMRDDFEIVAIVDDSPRKSPMYRDQVWDPAGYRIVSEAEAFDMPGVEVVFVEVTNRDLMEVAGAVADRGLPMHCDKPCGEDFAAYRAVVEKCRARNIPMQIGYMYRANPAVQFCQKAVRAGWLGEIGFIEADMNHAYNHDNYAEYMSTFEGGILYSLGCHLVDMIEPLVKGELLRASSVVRPAPFDPPGSRTSGAALLEFPSTEALIRTSSQMPGGILARRLRIDGSNGTIDLCPIERFDGGNLRLAMTLQKPAGGYAAGSHVIDFGALSDRYADQLRELAQTVRGEIPNDPAGYDRDLRVHRWVLKMCGLEDR